MGRARIRRYAKTGKRYVFGPHGVPEGVLEVRVDDDGMVIASGAAIHDIVTQAGYTELSSEPFPSDRPWPEPLPKPRYWATVADADGKVIRRGNVDIDRCTREPINDDKWLREPYMLIAPDCRVGVQFLDDPDPYTYLTSSGIITTIWQEER